MPRYDPESLLWPHEPGIEGDPGAARLLERLGEALRSLPVEALRTPAEVGRHLGARVVLAHLKFPRQGWTWYGREGALIEVANWLPEEVRDLVIGHEVCHLILGPPPERHDRLTERVCNWGAGIIAGRVGRNRHGASTGGGYSASRALRTTSCQ
jgi:hypothetical protein